MPFENRFELRLQRRQFFQLRSQNKRVRDSGRPHQVSRIWLLVSHSSISPFGFSHEGRLSAALPGQSSRVRAHAPELIPPRERIGKEFAFPSGERSLGSRHHRGLSERSSALLVNHWLSRVFEVCFLVIKRPARVPSEVAAHWSALPEGPVQDVLKECRPLGQTSFPVDLQHGLSLQAHGYCSCFVHLITFELERLTLRDFLLELAFYWYREVCDSCSYYGY